MKTLILGMLLFFTLSMQAQSCEEYLDFVKSKSYGTTYRSPLSDAISYVSFHTVSIDYQTYYFAIVCFKSKYAYGCSEYIYQVASMTSTYYAMNYMKSAGRAFWDYIQPYNQNLGCAPDF